MANENNQNQKGYALITGGTSGIGYELAKLFAADGYNLAIAARSEEGLMNAAKDLTDEFGIDVKTYSIDLMIPGAAKALYDEVSSSGITIEVLVNDAGQGNWGEFARADINRDVDVIHLNVIALTSLTKFYLNERIERGRGKILQLGSSLSKAPSPFFAVYAGTKAFVWSFTEALVQELKGTGVTVTALFPGATDTDFFHKAQAEDSVEYRETKLYDPKEVALAGFKGLMDGKDKVIPGAKNKMQGMMGAILPDKAVASNMKRHLKESEYEDGRTEITHLPSAKERERISRDSGQPDGDFPDHSRHSHEM